MAVSLMLGWHAFNDIQLTRVTIERHAFYDRTWLRALCFPSVANVFHRVTGTDGVTELLN